jgi:hypothetical protein
VPPFDPEAELSIVAELFDPLHRLVELPDTITPENFWDVRHQRIVARFQAGEQLSTDDAAYVRNAVGYAWPITQQGLAAFLDCAARRRRIRDLEAERMRLYGVTA